jgi:ABC-type multidrug transport system fused ATPase/permease subunit
MRHLDVLVLFVVVVQSTETSIHQWKNHRFVPPPPPQSNLSASVDDDSIIADISLGIQIPQSNRTKRLTPPPPPPPPPRTFESSSLLHSSSKGHVEISRKEEEVTCVRENPTHVVMPLLDERSLLHVPPPPPRDSTQDNHHIPLGFRKEEKTSSVAPPNIVPEATSVLPLVMDLPLRHLANPQHFDRPSEDPSSIEHRRMLLARLQEQDQLRRPVWEPIVPTRRNTFLTTPSTPPIRRPPLLWKSLWRTVENGLDQLVNFEDAMADRAQQWYSNTVQTKTVSSPLWSRRSFSRKKSYLQEPVEQLDLSRFRKTIRCEELDLPEGNKGRMDLEKSVGVNSQTSPCIAVANGGASTHPSHENESSSTAAVYPPPPPPGESSRYPPHPQQEQAKSADEIAKSGGSPSGQFGSSIPHQATKPTSERLLPLKTQTRSARWPSMSFSDPTATVTDPRPRQHAPPVNPSASKEMQTTTALYFDNDETSVLDRLKNLMPPLPNFRSFWRNRRTSVGDLATLDAWNSIEMNASPQDRRGVWSWLPKTKSTDIKENNPPLGEESKEFLYTEPMEDLTSRLRNGKMSSLLNVHEEELCKEIGRGKAFWDLISLIFLVAGVKELSALTVNFRLPNSFVETLTSTITDVLAILAASTETWIPILLISAYLASRTKYLLYETKENALIKSVESSIREESLYGSLFLRLVSSIPLQRSLPDKMMWATIAQIVSKVGLVHLQTLVMGILTTFFLVLISSLRVLVLDVFSVFRYLVVNRHQFSSLSGIRQGMEPLRNSFSKLIHESVHGIVHNPLMFVYAAMLLVSFVSVSLLPLAVERSRWINSDDDDGVRTHDEADIDLQIRFTEQLSHLGSSSASRLDLCSSEGRIDYFLQRWRGMMQPPRSTDVMAYRDDIASSWMSTARIIGFCAVSSLVLLAPLLMFLRNPVTFSVGGDGWLPLRLDSLFDYAAACILIQFIVWNTLRNTVAAREWKERISVFVSQLNTAIAERRQWSKSAPLNRSIRSSHQPYIVPTAGIAVSDLWASHATKRAWAVRGASFSCRNGEVVALLGDDGAGKTRLLTTVAEAILSPPRMASTTQKVRGTINVGGRDITKWNDNRQLRKHVGISLSDVRFVSDTSQILSGLSLEDILDPCSGKSIVSPADTKLRTAAMTLALRITGMDTALLQRLPSKLSTIVTANEDDLLHAATLLRPRFLQILSLAEWSKLLLTRTIARAIYENDHRQTDPSSISNTLIGSILLLDDVTLHLSEAEESRLLNDLRLTGAATIFSSHRWVSGRFADHVIVMKDSAIVETGTHTELINRGPQYSLYAAKWYAITNS